MNSAKEPPAAPALSVLVCAHNPNAACLKRTLAALSAQTLPTSQWELLLVDNASSEPLAQRFSLRWHPAARHVRADRLGLTAARCRGIGESRGQILVFVDDDNVLDADYLVAATRIAAERPYIGAWGGRVEPEFEVHPPSWLAPYLPLLAVNEVPVDQWSNLTTTAATPPCGAGMCLRRDVAEQWRNRVQTDPRRSALGRAGVSLASGEDVDMAFTACDMGYAAGRFTALRLKHLIPARRLNLDYFVNLVEAVTASQMLVRSLRETIQPPPAPTPLGWLRERWRDLHRDPASRRLCAAESRGRARGHRMLAEHRS